MGRPKKAPRTTEQWNRCALYLRVSAEDTRNDKNGLAVQRDAATEYAAKHGYTVVAELVDDGISGAKDETRRPGLAEVLRLCTSGAVDVVVCYAQDRLARRVGLFDRLRQTLVECGVRFETVKEAQDFTREEAMLMGDIYAAFAAEERRRIAGRLYGGRRVRSKVDGLGSGPVPWGYIRHKDGTITVDGAAALVIRVLLALRARGVTYAKTAAHLNDAGYITPKGGPWTIARVQGIERNAELYRTGVRRWDGVVAAQRWPVIAPQS